MDLVALEELSAIKMSECYNHDIAKKLSLSRTKDLEKRTY